MNALHARNSTIVRSDAEDTIDDAVAPQAAATAAAPAQEPEATWLKVDWRVRALRASMHLLGRTSPWLAARLFDRIWFSAPRTRPKPQTRALLDRAEQLSLRVHGRRVAAWSWGVGPTVVLLHGWGGNAGQMRAFVAPLVDTGFRVVAFDAPAHGASAASRHGGRRVSFIEIAEALRVVTTATGPLAGLVAHSGGCAAAALAIRDGWSPPARMVFVAPFALPEQAVAPFGRLIGADERVIERFRERTVRWFGRPWSDFEVPRLPAERDLPPLLLVHDVHDAEVPFLHSQAIAAAWPAVELHATQGLGHRGPLHDPAVVARAARFLQLATKDTRPASTPADGRDELDRYFAASNPC